MISHSSAKPVFIDYEHAGYNYKAYELANLIEQLSINYDIKEAPYFKLEEKMEL